MVMGQIKMQSNRNSIPTILGMKIDLLNINSVRKFSNGSVAVYVPNNQHNCPETIININVTDAPNGIYVLKITPVSTVEKTETRNNHYNLLVNTKFVQSHENEDIDTSTGKLQGFIFIINKSIEIYLKTLDVRLTLFIRRSARTLTIWNIEKQKTEENYRNNVS